VKGVEFMNVAEKILRLENEYRLNSINIDGFHVWTYMRFLIWESLHYKRIKTKKKIWNIIKNGISDVALILRILFGGKYECCLNRSLLFVCQGRRVLDGDVYESTTTDELAIAFPNSITLEHPYKQRYHFLPTKTKAIVYSDKIILKAYIYSQLIKYFHRKRYKLIYRQIKELFEIPINELFVHSKSDVNRWLDRMTCRYFVYLSRYKNYEHLLKKISPNLIVEDVHYSIDNMIINELAKKMHIPTIELQHGIIGEGHIAYNYSLDESIPQFPDMIMLFSDYWKETATYPIENDKLIPVGFPYFERQVNEYKKNSYDLFVRAKTVVFLSQPNGVTKGLDVIAVNTHNRLNEHDWKVIFKLHPSEYDGWQMVYPMLVNTDIEVIDSQQKSLYEIFSISKALVGVCSTSIYEGIGFGLAAFIYDMPGSERMDDICEREFATKVSDSENLCEYLLNMNDNYEVKSEELWKSNALENMKEIIVKILEQK